MLENREGQRVPQANFKTRVENDWVELTSDDVFKGKTVAVFSLPGAFTPTCSSSHVPRYNQLAGRFKQLGVDQIVCVSVNDAFVMNEWKEAQKADDVMFLPDGNGQFTDGMGMLVGKEDLGFGKRSWRYSMLVKDGVIDKMFVEPQEPGDPYGVSDADSMLEYLAPNAPKPLDITVFSRKGCEHCARAKGILRDTGIAFEALELNVDYTDRTLRAVADATSLPQIFINGKQIGGADELQTWLKSNSITEEQRTAA
ncbi:MAG: glutathione peroxidase [Woeseia sp.]|nr:glutathione peroxidase [Woeseia sp.]NNE59923.1 glutathione peroxidase [Woeseia sp.]NNL53961.1 glutathione peroxidase [Woeseia sp.]